MLRLTELVDILGGRTTKYEYDILGRLVTEKVIQTSKKNVLSKLKLRYDDTKNRIAGYDVTVSGNTNSIDYDYGGA